MSRYIFMRLRHMAITMILVSIVSFVIIELPPGDFLTVLQNQLQSQQMSNEQIEGTLKVYKERFGLDQPIHVRYLKWVFGLLRGDLGYSMMMSNKVGILIGERIALTLLLSVATLIFTMAVSVPIGIYSAIRQYSAGDYLFTFIGFIGLAIPDFLLALILLFVVVTVFGASGVGGLFSSEYITAPWSFGKALDLIKHLWLPVIIVGTSGAAGTIRVMRARMIDALGEPYVQTARMKGLAEARVVLVHALKVAINPIITSLGLSLPGIISGATIVSVVLVLPTVGPLLLNALLAEDMYLACTILLLLTMALVVGNFFADLALAWIDPRIRYD